MRLGDAGLEKMLIFRSSRKKELSLRQGKYNTMRGEYLSH